MANLSSFLRANAPSTSTGTQLETVAYDSRHSLRSKVKASGDQILVTGLGLFAFDEASQEPDDDETCFVTSNGRWILECPHWEMVEALINTQINYGLKGLKEVLYGTGNCPLTTLAASSKSTFNATVLGAVPGDLVLTSPQNGAVPASVICSGAVTAADTVTISLSNVGSAAVSLTDMSTVFPIMVFQPR